MDFFGTKRLMPLHTTTAVAKKKRERKKLKKRKSTTTTTTPASQACVLFGHCAVVIKGGLWFTWSATARPMFPSLKLVWRGAACNDTVDRPAGTCLSFVHAVSPQTPLPQTPRTPQTQTHTPPHACTGVVARPMHGVRCAHSRSAGACLPALCH